MNIDSGPLKKALLALIPNLRAFAVSLCGDVERADDLVQETLLKAWNHLESFEQGTNLRAWLHRIQANAFYGTCRTRRRRPQEFPLDAIEPSSPERTAVASSAEDAALARMPDPVLKRALRELPDRLAATVYLADAEGYSYAEIARITGVPVGTVMSRLHRARKRLRARLADSMAAGQERPGGPRQRTRAA